jgi:hypothetical protein
VAKARAKKDQRVNPDPDADRGADDAGAGPDVDAGAASDPGHVGVTLLVDDDSLDDLDGVLRRARKAGLRDGQVLAAAGVITGTAPPDTIHELALVRGIRSAEPERTIQLPPPDQPQ